jgi:hypothetical protein
LRKGYLEGVSRRIGKVVRMRNGLGDWRMSGKKSSGQVREFGGGILLRGYVI